MDLQMLDSADAAMPTLLLRIEPSLRLRSRRFSAADF